MVRGHWRPVVARQCSGTRLRGACTGLHATTLVSPTCAAVTRFFRLSLQTRRYVPCNADAALRVLVSDTLPRLTLGQRVCTSLRPTGQPSSDTSNPVVQDGRHKIAAFVPLQRWYDAVLAYPDEPRRLSLPNRLGAFRGSPGGTVREFPTAWHFTNVGIATVFLASKPLGVISSWSGVRLVIHPELAIPYRFAGDRRRPSRPVNFGVFLYSS